VPDADDKELVVLNDIKQAILYRGAVDAPTTVPKLLQYPSSPRVHKVSMDSFLSPILEEIEKEKYEVTPE
jgi:hypothetical protein